MNLFPMKKIGYTDGAEGVKPAVSYYRVFAHYIGENLNIVPEDMLHDIIEPMLNSPRMVEYYADKNVYDKQFPKGFFPKTIFRRIDGVYLYRRDFTIL